MSRDKNLYSVLFVLCALLLPILTKFQNHEKLTFGQHYNEIQIVYQPSDILPSTFNSLFESMNIQWLQLNMGFSTNNKYQSFEEGIFLYIKNKTIFDEKSITTFGQLFSISRDTEYSVYLPQLALIYASNPNDKFCSQHLDNIVNNFLPCRVNSGLASLINQKTIFTKQFFGLNVFMSRSKVQIHFIIPKSVQQLQKYKDNQRQKSQSKCFKFQYQQILDSFQMQRSSEELNFRIIKNNKIYEYFTKSQWYNRQKSLIAIFDKKQVQNLFQNTKVVSLTANFYIPFGFQIVSISSDCQQFGCENFMPKVKDKTLQMKLTFAQNELKSNATQKLTIQVKVKSYLKGFQDYQTINGGGQQFMRVPTILMLQNGVKLVLLPDQVSQRLLQPDFSIPFHTITFTIAILGYIWLAVWKTYFKQQRWLLKNKYKKQ